jgi:hypothetical protein
MLDNLVAAAAVFEQYFPKSEGASLDCSVLEP